MAMTDNHTELCERLSADAGDVGKNYSSPIGHRIDDAVMLIEQLAARIAELEKERDALIHDNAQLLKAASAEATLASEALAERDALKADAKRYQWLRSQHEMQETFEDSEGFTVRSPAENAWTVFRPGRTTSLEPVSCTPGELDKAIDAEIEYLDRAKEE